MTTATTDKKQLGMPEARMPVVNRVLSRDPVSGEAITWEFMKPHPITPELQIVRMFRDEQGVEVYAGTEGGKMGVRNLLPSAQVLFVEEIMDATMFVEEIAAAEQDGEPEADPSPALQPTQTNGATAS